MIGAGERTAHAEPSLLRGDLWRAIDPLRPRVLAERTQLARRLEELRARAPRASVVTVVSDLHDPLAAAALRELAQRHDVAVIHTIDPAELGGLRAGFVRGFEAESGRGFLAGPRTRWSPERAVGTELVRAGVDYLALRTDRPFVPALRHFLGVRGRLLRGRR